jgi:hypothetical protein
VIGALFTLLFGPRGQRRRESVRLESPVTVRADAASALTSSWAAVAEAATRAACEAWLHSQEGGST